MRFLVDLAAILDALRTATGSYSRIEKEEDLVEPEPELPTRFPKEYGPDEAPDEVQHFESFGYKRTMSQNVVTRLNNQIVGVQLSGVAFVMSYLQLEFDPPPTINAYTPVTVVCAGMAFVSGDDQFRNRLCDQITKIVKWVVIKDEEGFVITFEDESVISISLKLSDYVGSEAMKLIGHDNLWMVI